VSSEGIPFGPGHEGWTQNADILKQYTVYFDFDSSAIRSDEQSKIASVADQLKGQPTAAVLVEGHCDERGTEEYNRALGERRALAIRTELVRLGIDPSRVDTTSYGKDRPADSGQTEAAYARNRRGEFILLTPPGT
jgi:peptidoglycan-associated lipoprotein